MKSRTKLLLTIIVIVVVIIVLLVGSLLMYKHKKERQLVKDLDKTIFNVYPIKNLEDLYNIEGYKDENFDKQDKGTWYLNSAMNIQRKGEDLKSEGMLLKINRNTKTAKGYYYISSYFTDKRGSQDSSEKRYPVKMVNNKFIITKPVHDNKVKNKIKNFKFFVQYGDFKDLKTNQYSKLGYNPNVPSYTLEYNLNNEENNVKKLREIYNIPKKKKPKLLIEGKSSLDHARVGYKSIEFSFIKRTDETISFTDNVNLQPSNTN